jgi:hypothetical protein
MRCPTLRMYILVGLILTLDLWPFAVTNGVFVASHRCALFQKMNNGTCYLASDGIHLNVTPTLTRRGLWCDAPTSGHFEGHVMENSQWVADGCDLFPVKGLPDVLNHVSSKVMVVLMGDSHMRNTMTGLAAAFRNTEIVVEGHPTKDWKASGLVSVYHIWHETTFGFGVGARQNTTATTTTTIRDSFQNIVNVTGNEIRILSAAKRHCSKFARCATHVFVWAPTFQHHVDMIPHVRHVLNPNMLLTSINSHETTLGFHSQTYQLYESWFRNSQSLLRVVAFFNWPFGKYKPGVLRERTDAMDTLVATFQHHHNARGGRRVTQSHRDVRCAIRYDHAYYHNQSKEFGENFVQTLKTWHSVCSIRENWPSPALHVIEYEPCTALVAKTFARMMWTMYTRCTSTDL